MPRYDFRTPRLFLEQPIEAGRSLELSRAQANYLVNVLRLADGEPVLLFNGRDGEWRANLRCGRRAAMLEVLEQTRPQTAAGDLEYLFAPLKHARLDYMVQKAVEMGAGRLRPVLTRHGQVGRVNRQRMVANAIEAAEQCGILSIPVVDAPIGLDEIVATWSEREPRRRLIFCDEGAARADSVAALSALPKGPMAVLIGPEGGFAADERATLRAAPFVTTISLGPRILRADTAAVAA